MFLLGAGDSRKRQSQDRVINATTGVHTEGKSTGKVKRTGFKD
jgi:hypothetical protein